MPSRYYEDDLKGIPRPIRDDLKVCQRALYEDPCDLEKALNKANEAKQLAMLFREKDIERRIRFYRAECYRKMRDWEEALRLYKKCTVVTEGDERWLRKMRLLCRFEIWKLRRDNYKWPCRDIIRSLGRDIIERLRGDDIERPPRDRPHRDNMERSRRGHMERSRRDDMKRPHRDDMERSRRDSMERLRRNNVDTSRRHRDNPETSKPRKSSRPSHQEGRAKVKEYRGKKKRVSWG